MDSNAFDMFFRPLFEDLVVGFAVLAAGRALVASAACAISRRGVHEVRN